MSASSQLRLAVTGGGGLADIAESAPWPGGWRFAGAWATELYVRRHGTAGRARRRGLPVIHRHHGFEGEAEAIRARWVAGDFGGRSSA